MKFLQWIVSVWMLSLAFISLASLQGQGEADALAAFGFGSCEGQPCYRGIVPGVTRWDDVRTYLDGATIRSDDGTTIAVTLTERMDIEIFRETDTQPVVTAMRVSDYTIIELMPSKFPSVGHFLLTYGTPCLVIVDGSDSTRARVARLVYPTLVIDLFLTEPLTPSAPVRRVWIDKANFDLCADDYAKSAGVSWDGFAEQHTYLKTLIDKPLTHFE